LWLLHLNAGTIDPRAVVVGLALASCLALGFVMVQRRGIVHIDRIARILGRGWAARTAAGAALLHAALESIYRYRSGIWASFLLHFGCWVVSAAEMWVALRLANAPLPFGTMIVIESLVYATRAVAFVVPNSVGVQEGAYVVLGTAFGLSPEMGLALSLLKRARDLTIGMPVLVVWQAIEGGRLMRRAAAKAPGAPMGERE
jgi:putative membrane protein